MINKFYMLMLVVGLITIGACSGAITASFIPPSITISGSDQ